MGSGLSKKSNSTSSADNSQHKSNSPPSADNSHHKSNSPPSADNSHHKSNTPVKPTSNINHSAQKSNMSKKTDTKTSDANSQTKKTSKWQTTDVEELMKELSIRPTEETFHWWDVIDHLVVKQDPVIKPMKQRKTWKTVRLFISSTFKDMSSERECLVKTVVPALRNWCMDRKLRLVECDLRWGVPKDSDTRETLMACLSEIDRCREENEFPYFLNMLSERYGSVMKPDDVPADIKARYNWLPGMSVTALEVFTGAYWDRNPNALYMMRKDDFLKGVKDETILKAYKESDKSTEESLLVLKGKIREKYGSQTHDYTCHVEKTENKKLILGGLEAFGETVFKHFQACIERQYPADLLDQTLTDTEIVRADQEDFLILRSHALRGRDDIMKKMCDYIESGDTSATVMSLVGSAGAGKSSLMAASARDTLQNSQYKVFFHFYGATPDSTSSYSLLSRFFQECMPPGSVIPIDPDEMMRYTGTMFSLATQEALSQGYKKLVVYTDALNQMDDDGMAHGLTWLPRKLPTGMRLIVSTLEGNTLDALRSHKVKCHEVIVEPLNVAYRKSIATDYLAEFNKQLDSEQMELLVTKEDSGRPLYLAISCEELRVFGDFRKLTDKVRNLPESLSGVIEIVLKRVVSEYGKDLVQATLCLIETSRFGLAETELLELLAVDPVVPTSKSSVQFTGENIHMAKWAFVYLGLCQFLRPCGGASEGRLDFYHRTSSKVVRQVFLSNPSTKVSYHRRLGAFFNQSKDLSRKCEELPFHLIAAEDKVELRALLLSLDVFEHLSQDKHKQELMKYWQYLGGYQEAAAGYSQFLSQHISTHNLQDTDEGYQLQTRVCWFLIDIGQYDTALATLYSVIQGSKKKYGDMARELADPLHAVMKAVYRQAQTYVYNTHPGYQAARRNGEKYCKLCEKIHRLYWKEDDNHLGRVLTMCAYFDGSLLQNCQTIFEKTNNMRGLAEVLYMMGEKTQYNKDIGKPEALFEKSLALCLASYGRLHLQTARCYQLYGQLYWNNWSSTGKRTDWLEKCLALYTVELEILEEVQGKLHPNTVRSREDVIIILQNLQRPEEAQKYNEEQPADAKTIA